MIHVFSDRNGDRELRDGGRLFENGATGLFAAIADAGKPDSVFVVFNFCDAANNRAVAEVFFDFLRKIDRESGFPVSIATLSSPPDMSIETFIAEFHGFLSETFRDHCFVLDESDYAGFLTRKRAGSGATHTVCYGTIGRYLLETVLYRSCLVHDIKVNGPINLEERIPLYKTTISFHKDTDYYCILDNSDNHENELDLEGIRVLDEILIGSGIAHFFGVTISEDPGYDAIVRLGRTHAEMRDLSAELHRVTDRDSAWTLLDEAIAKRQAPGTAS